MEEAGFTIYAKALFTGTFDECLAYKNEYPTTISKLHGLPDLEDNICEGNVLKPMKAMCKPSGSRIILKNKNDRFKEKESSKKVKVKKEIPPELQEAINVAAGYITENRLRNVLSHIGEVSQKEFGKVIGAFSQDVLADFEKENADLLKDFERDELNTINKAVGKESANLIRANFLNIVDGNF
jgi:Rnl2 family RNA ligase